MNKANAIISYFYEYDFYDSLLTTSIDKLACKSLPLNNSNFHYFSTYVTQQKINNLSDWFKQKKHISKKQLNKDTLENYVMDTISLEQLLTDDVFQTTKFFPDDKKTITDIKSNDEFYLFYPILIQKDGKEHPIISFTCKLTDTSYEITKHVANQEALTILLSSHLKQDTLDVKNLYAEQIADLIVAINAIEDVTDIREFNQLFLVEFEQALGFHLKNVSASEWSLTAQLKISCEPLESISGSCFEDELKTLQRFVAEKKEQLPPLLHNYLYHDQKQRNLNNITLAKNFHYGSYHSNYSVTAKQWELVNLLPQADFLAVEGPPGTGKTTLLKEIIADRIVHKASELLNVWNNDWQFDSRKSIYQSPLGGKNLDSIILTSTNNKAINNIGLELLKEIPFFSDFAASIDDKTINGIFCARLGKYDNIKHFYQTFFAPFLQYLAKTELDDDTEEEAIAVFTRTRQEIEHYNTFLNQFLSFKKQKDITSACMLNEAKERIQVDITQSLAQSQEIEKTIQTLHSQSESFKNNVDALTIQLNQLKQDSITSELEKKNLFNAKESFKKINAAKRILCKLPFIFNFTKELLSTYPSLEYISDLIVTVNNKLEEITIQQTNFEQPLLENKARLLTEQKKIRTMTEQKEQQQKILSENERTLKELISMSKQIELFSEEYDIEMLWTAETHMLKNTTCILKLREKMFHAALKLLEIYIIKNKQYILKNLEKVLSEDHKWFKCLYNGNNPYDDARANLLRSLYETFFLCFPIVSTTLHSFRKQTFPMIENLFDLLLFDESGQIVPYYAAAPLYRARKAVFVGDTNQIEPIISVPEKILQEKYTNLLDEETYASLCLNTNSAQSYAIKGSQFYENRNQTKHAIVLNEHMRCEPSIMNFSNQYVYDNVLTFMTEDTTVNKLLNKNLLAFDIRGAKSIQHFNQAEVEACKRIVATLVAEYGDSIKQQIGIITPFSKQAKKIKQSFNNELAVGTVHTFQGDEKQIIIFSSIIDNLNNKSHGLANFIGKKANLLNVAFSRAKKQFIYLGNFDAARETQNYLSKALHTIAEHGTLYSLYNSVEMTNDQNELKKVIGILSDSSLISKDSLITDYLNTTIPENIIYGGKQHNEILMKLIYLAENSITVISPWISDYVVNEEFLKIINTQVKKATDVKIFFGHKGKKRSSKTEIEEIVKNDMPWNKDGALKAITALSNLLNDNLIHNPPSHIKMLLIDNTYLFIGSLNWLMNSGRTQQKEISCLVTDKSSIDYITKYLTK